MLLLLVLNETPGVRKTEFLARFLCREVVSRFIHRKLNAQIFISSILPKDLLEDTLRSLALLLPRANIESKRWYQKNLKRYPNLDPKAGDLTMASKDRVLDEYTFWKERLEIIVEAYNKSEPKALPQWWNDRRNKVQWYTFWIAALVLLLTIVFGLIQSITGILQVYYTSRAP